MIKRMNLLHRALCVAVLVLLAPDAKAQPSGTGPITSNPRSFAISDGRTPGGIRLVHMPLGDEKDQVFAFAWRDRLIQHMPEKAGLMNLAPGLVSTGGAGPLDAGAQEEELQDIGGYFGLSRGRVSTLGLLTAPKEQFEATARLLRISLMEPRLPAITLERRKRFLANNRRADREKAESIASEALSLIMAGNHPIAATIGYSPPSTIASVSVADVDAWRKAILARSNLMVVSAGPLSREAAADLVDRTFGDLPAQDGDREGIAFTLPPGLSKTIVIEIPVAQSAIVVGGPLDWRLGGPEGTSRNIAMSVLGGGNRSRLFIAVREKLGAAYGANAGFSAILGSRGAISMNAAVSNDKVAVALAAMRTEYETFRTKGVTPEEIEPIKRRMINSLPDSMRKAGSAANTIRTSILNGQPFDAPDLFNGWVDNQSAASINRLIEERLPTKLITIIVTPSAEGLGADCVIKTLDELPRCLNQ